MLRALRNQQHITRGQHIQSGNEGQRHVDQEVPSAALFLHLFLIECSMNCRRMSNEDERVTKTLETVLSQPAGTMTQTMKYLGTKGMSDRWKIYDPKVHAMPEI